MFWLSYECFFVLWDAFLLKGVISSHNDCVSGVFGYKQMFLGIFALGVNKLH